MSAEAVMGHCPICVEAVDAHDKRFFPCPCGFQIKASSNLCPKCRGVYREDKIEFRNISDEAEEEDIDGVDDGGESYRSASSCSSTASSSTGAKATTVSTISRQPPSNSASRKSVLRDVRVVRRDLCYLVGLPLEAVADENALKEFSFFGKYGKVVNIIVNRNPNFKCPDKKKSCAVYITYSSHQEAKYAIQDIDDCTYQGRKLRASYGTTKYCSNYLRNQKCNNKTCFYLHQKGAQQDSFTIDQLNHVKEKSKNLTCSAILSHELTHGVRPTPLGTNLFGMDRKQVVDCYVDLLSKRMQPALPTTTATAPAAVKYASLRHQFSATLKKTMSVDKPVSSNSSEEDLDFVVLPSVRDEVMGRLNKSGLSSAVQNDDEKNPTLANSIPNKPVTTSATPRSPPASPDLIPSTFALVPPPPTICSLTIHPSLQKEWGWGASLAHQPFSSSQNIIDWSLKALASPLHPKDGSVGPPKSGPSRLLNKSCVTSADLTVTYSPGTGCYPELWFQPQEAAGPPPGLY